MKAVAGGRWQVAGGKCRVSGVGCRVSGVRCRVSGVRCRVSGVGCRVSGVRCRVSGVGCRPPATCHLPPATFCLPLLPFAFFFLLLLLSACAAPAEPTAAPPVPALSIAAPGAVDAGAAIPLTVQTDGAAGEIFLLATGTFGSIPFTATVAGGEASFTLAPPYTRHAGAVTFLARSGDAQAQAETRIRPGPPVDPILPLVGPRSIVADAAHWTMLVAVPVDRFGNPLADGFPVTVRAQHPAPEGGDPQSGVEVQTTQIERLFAWARVYSRTKAGRTFLSFNAGEAHSPERDVLEVPGRPLPFRLFAQPEVAVADGRQTVQISSEQIRDRFDNLLLDGTSVQLLAESSDGSRRVIPTFTQDGRIYARLQSPAAPGSLRVQALVDDVLSETLSLRFTPGPAVRAFPIAVALTDDALLLTAGPLVGPIGQFIPDGTAVRFTLTDPDGAPLEAEAVAEYGYARLRLPRSGLFPGEYRVQAAVGTGAGWNGFVVR